MIGIEFVIFVHFFFMGYFAVNAWIGFKSDGFRGLVSLIFAVLFALSAGVLIR